MTDSTGSPRPLRGLLVDNEDEFGEQVSQLLQERLGDRGLRINIRPCTTPEDAVKHIRTSSDKPPFDLVMTDMLFPPVGRPDAPLTDHVQRGIDVMNAALALQVPVIIGFTQMGPPRFQEMRTRCSDIGVSLCARDDLIVAEQDSIVGDLAAMLQGRAVRLSTAGSKIGWGKKVPADRKSVAVICPSEGLKYAMCDFLKAVGLSPVDFDTVVHWNEDPLFPSAEVIDRLFSQVQAVLVLVAPARTRRRAQSGGKADIGAQASEDRRVDLLVKTGMLLVTSQDQTVIVRLQGARGQCKLYQHSLVIDDSLGTRVALAERLAAIGCPVDHSAVRRWSGSFKRGDGPLTDPDG